MDMIAIRVIFKNIYFVILLELKGLVESLRKEVKGTKEELTATQNQVSWLLFKLAHVQYMLKLYKLYPEIEWVMTFFIQ